MAAGLSGQKEMERLLKLSAAFLGLKLNRISNMTRPRVLACDHAEGEAWFEFPVMSWELNPVGYLHGGATSALFDVGLSMLAIACCGGEMLPTVELSTAFVRPVPPCGKVIVHARVAEHGDSFIHVDGELVLPPGAQPKPKRFLFPFPRRKAKAGAGGPALAGGAEEARRMAAAGTVAARCKAVFSTKAWARGPVKPAPREP